MTQEQKRCEEEEKLVPQGIVKFIRNEFSRSTLARKVYESYIYIPVPQTDTGR